MSKKLTTEQKTENAAKRAALKAEQAILNSSEQHQDVVQTRVNAFFSVLTEIATKELKRSQALLERFAQFADSQDEKDSAIAQTRHDTLHVFMKRTQALSVYALLESFAQSAVIECASDIKSYDKVRQFADFLAHRDFARIHDNKLSKFLCLFTDFEDTAIVEYRKFHAACDHSDRQTQMCAKLFERLNLLQREKHDSKSFNMIRMISSDARELIVSIVA